MATTNTLRNGDTYNPYRGLVGPDGQPLSHPRGNDGFPIPRFLQTVAYAGGLSQTYWHDRWDEARRKSREDAAAMERDAYLESLLQERRLATATLKWHVAVDDEKDVRQKLLKDGMQRILRATPWLTRMHYETLRGVFWGRSANQRVYEYRDVSVPGITFQPGIPGVAPAAVTVRDRPRRSLCVSKHAPVHGDSIGHKLDGRPYVVVNSAESSEFVGAEITSVIGNVGRGIVLQGDWRERFVLYSHESRPAEFFDWERSEGAFGVGVRDVVFWHWWLKQEFMEWFTTYFERVGLGVNVWQYEAGNDASFREVTELARRFGRKTDVFVPFYPGKAGGGVGGLERLETPVAGAEAITAIMGYLDSVIERYYVGQSMSAGADSESGLGGSGRAKFASRTKSDLVRYDAENLGECYTQDWVRVVQRYTYPELSDVPCRWQFNVPDPESAERLTAVQTAISFGVDFVKDEVRGLTGMSDPQPGDDTVGGALAAPPGEGEPGEGEETPEGEEPKSDVTSDLPPREEADDPWQGILYAEGRPERYALDRLAGHPDESHARHLDAAFANQDDEQPWVDWAKHLHAAGHHNLAHLVTHSVLAGRAKDQWESSSGGRAYRDEDLKFNPFDVIAGNALEHPDVEALRAEQNRLWAEKERNENFMAHVAPHLTPEERRLAGIAWKRHVAGLHESAFGQSPGHQPGSVASEVAYDLFRHGVEGAKAAHERAGDFTPAQVTPASAKSPAERLGDWWRGRGVTRQSRAGKVWRYAAFAQGAGSPWFGYEHVGKAVSGRPSSPLSSSVRHASEAMAEAIRTGNNHGIARPSPHRDYVAGSGGHVTAHDRGAVAEVTHNAAVAAGNILGRFHIHERVLPFLKAIDAAHAPENRAIGTREVPGIQFLFDDTSGRSGQNYAPPDQAPASIFADYLEENGHDPAHSHVAQKIRDQVANWREGGHHMREDQARSDAAVYQAAHPGHHVVIEPSEHGHGAFRWRFKDDRGAPPTSAEVLHWLATAPREEPERHAREGVERYAAFDPAKYITRSGLHQVARVGGRFHYSPTANPSAAPHEYSPGHATPEDALRAAEHHEAYGVRPSEEEMRAKAQGSAEGAPPPKVQLPTPSQVKQLGEHGKSKARVEHLSRASEATADRGLKKLGLSLQDLPHLVGAPDDAVVRAQGALEGQDQGKGEHAGHLGVTIHHPHFGWQYREKVLPSPAERNFGVDGMGERFMENIGLFVKPEHQKSGLGRDVFVRQVENLLAHGGFRYIMTHAARQSGDPTHPHVGYSYWPEMGYDADLRQFHHALSGPRRELGDKLRAEFPGAKTVQDVLAKPGGAAWWRQHGQDLFDAKFDLDPNGRSVAILKDRLAEKAAKKPTPPVV